MLSPQHWAQSANDTYPNRNGTTCITTLDAVILSWNQGKYKRTVKLDKHTNTARFKSASGSLQYQLFAASIEYKLNQLSTEDVSYTTKNHISSDNEDSKQFSKSHAKQTTDKNHIISKRANDFFEENLSDYLMDPGPVPTNVIEEEENQLAARDIQAELLRWHHRLGHLSFQKLKLLALLRVIPSNLATAHPPKCAGCIYGALTKRPWRTKSLKDSSKLFTATKPGECVSVDQLESTTPGFIAQFKGALTKDRYRAATVFVDHFSRFSYIHLQRGLTSAETVQAKRAFESFSQAHGVTIKHYHCDNGRFADNAYLEHVTKSGQTITYCGVNAHFQNGIAEKRI